MSWMDSWSRPSKHASTPPPLYLTQGDTVPYCHSCGRVISSRRTQASTNVKYCSDRCKHRKPGPLDKKIEDVFVALLNGSSVSIRSPDEEGDVGNERHGVNQGRAKAREIVIEKSPRDEKRKKKMKGDPRITVMCNEIEEIVFGSRHDPTKIYGRKKNRATRALGGTDKVKEWRSVDMESDDDDAQRNQPANSIDGSDVEDDTSSLDGGSPGGGVPVSNDHGNSNDNSHSGNVGPRIRAPQIESEVNFSVGGERGWAEKIEETPEMAEKRRQGQRRAEEKEMVRRAARRGCAFGFVDPGFGAAEDDGDGSERASLKKKTRKKRGGIEGEGGDGKHDNNPEVRKCEALMKEQVVEASFAKGDFGVRWRERE